MSERRGETYAGSRALAVAGAVVVVRSFRPETPPDALNRLGQQGGAAIRVWALALALAW